MAGQRRARDRLRDDHRAPARRRALRRLAHRPRRGLSHDEPGARRRTDRAARDRRLRGRRPGLRMSAIVGVAESDLGVVAPGMTPADLMAQASLRALEDCGLTTADVDGLFGAASQMPMPALNLGAYLGIEARHLDTTNIGGSSFEAHVNHARLAIEAGACDVALIASGSTQRWVGRAQAATSEVSPYEAPYKPMLPIAGYALAASRHMHEFGTTREQLAEVAVAARRWA